MDRSKAPAPWSVDAVDGAAGDCLRLGHRVLRLGEIASHSRAATAELNVAGQLAAAGGFTAAAAALALPVAFGLLEPRFVIGAALFGGIAFATVSELRQASQVMLYRVQIHLKDGRTETFASADPDECARLDEMLCRRLRLED
ncbi:MAG: hypothetical protein R3D44_18435 [Hyphomicrobiaceae bacterium]